MQIIRPRYHHFPKRPLPAVQQVGQQSQPPVALPALSGHPLLQGVAAIWLGTMGGGGILRDLSGYQNHAVFQNGLPAWNRSNTSFVPGTTWATAPDNSVLSAGTDKLSIVAWVSPLSTNRVICGKPHASTHTSPFFKYALFFTATVGGTVEFRIDATTLAATSNLVNRYCQVAGTYDGANMRVYVDGGLEGTTAKTGAVQISTEAFYIGATRAGGQIFDGSIVAVMVFNRVLDASQLKALLNPYAILNTGAALPIAAPITVDDDFTITDSTVSPPTPVSRDILQHWSISEQLNERGTMRFGIKSMDASYRPLIREQIDFNWAGQHFFAGHIHHTDEAGLGGYGVVPIVTQCGATDFNALPDRRQVAITLPAGTLKSMLELLEPYLTDYGVTLDPSQVNGPALVELTFTLGTLTAILDKLSVVSEYAWNISYDKVLSMFAPGTVAAPFDLVDGDTRVIGDVRVSPTTVDYANRIIVLAGTGTADVADNFVGDGVEDTFELNYTPVTFYGYVTVNGTNFETLRVAGDPDAADWEYNPATNEITRLIGAPANLDTIVITFVAQFPFEVIAEDVPAQAGGANLIEKVFTHPEVFDAATAQALADGYLVRSLVQPREIRYRTRLHGVHPGMQQQIQRTGRNVDGPCLITGVEITPEGSALYNYDITAVEGLTIVQTIASKWRQMTGAAA